MITTRVYCLPALGTQRIQTSVEAQTYHESVPLAILEKKPRDAVVLHHPSVELRSPLFSTGAHHSEAFLVLRHARLQQIQTDIRFSDGILLRSAIPAQELQDWTTLWASLSPTQRRQARAAWCQVWKTEGNQKPQWKKVTGPIRAVIATLQGLGWYPNPNQVAMT